MKYVLAVDGSQTSEMACHSLLKMVHAERDKVWVLSTSDPLPFGFPNNDSFDRRLEEATRTMQEPIEHQLQAHRIPYELHQMRGHAGETICQFAEEQGADMIVLGTRGLSGFWKWMSGGSTSEYVLSHSKIPVTVVRFSDESNSPSKAKEEGEAQIEVVKPVRAGEEPIDREYYRMDYREAGAM